MADVCNLVDVRVYLVAELLHTHGQKVLHLGYLQVQECCRQKLQGWFLETGEEVERQQGERLGQHQLRRVRLVGAQVTIVGEHFNELVDCLLSGVLSAGIRHLGEGVP